MLCRCLLWCTIAEFCVTEAYHAFPVLRRDLETAEVVVLSDEGGDGAVEAASLNLIRGRIT